MIEFRPCAPADVQALWRLSAEPDLGFAELSAGEAWRFCEPGLSHSMWIDGRLAACGGVVQEWPGRGTAWILVRHDLDRRHWVLARRQMRDVIAEAHRRGFGRIEARVHDRFAGGCALVRKLGFEVETHKPRYWPSGAGCFEFARLEWAA